MAKNRRCNYGKEPVRNTKRSVKKGRGFFLPMLASLAIPWVFNKITGQGIHAKVRRRPRRVRQ